MSATTQFIMFFEDFDSSAGGGEEGSAGETTDARTDDDAVDKPAALQESGPIGS